MTPAPDPFTYLYADGSINRRAVCLAAQKQALRHAEHYRRWLPKSDFCHLIKPVPFRDAYRDALAWNEETARLQQIAWRAREWRLFDAEQKRRQREALDELGRAA